MVASAIVFLVVIFLIKNEYLFSNTINNTDEEQNNAGLTYNSEIIGDLVARDLDGDGVLDWEEGLWGTDPTKKDSNDDGVLDKDEIEKLKEERGITEPSDSLTLSLEEENLTETDKFSREFFSTVATLNQSGQMDQETMDKLGSSLAEHIQNSTPKKVFILSDIKTTGDDIQTVQIYSASFIKIETKYTLNYTVMDVLQKFIVDENNVDSSVLVELDPIINQTNNVINELAKMSVPQSLALLHLDFLNTLQRLSENVSDIQLYDTDVIVALSAISQYNDNTANLESTVNNLRNAINNKLNN